MDIFEGKSEVRRYAADRHPAAQPVDIRGRDLGEFLND
ncbi:hypothetical protein ATKI12_3726 [Kitasatospora sp. Ki12]